MAGNVGWSTLDVIPSVKNLRSQLEKQTAGDFAAAGRKGGQQFGDAAAHEAGGRFKSKFSPVIRNAFAPAAGILAGAGIVEGFQSVIGAASDAQQSVGGVQAVFKDYADEVVNDSKRAEQGLGLSKTAYQELVTVSGALLKNKGLEDFADQAEKLLGIGADLAAQFGGSTKDAVDALNAALRGESDPIERYAISLNQTAVNAVLAANGQQNLTGAALEHAKTQARLTLITQQSADAMGAFGREVDTQAGQAARTSAQWANMRAELGERLLPATQAFTGFLNDQGLPALEATGGAVSDVVGFLDDMPGPLKAATAAWVAYRVAQASGLATGVQGAFAASSSGLDSVRLRGLLAADAYRQLRAGQVEVVNNSGRFTPAVGRMTAGLGALQAGAVGAGSGLRRGLAGASALVGGPWGAAFIAGTAIVGHFWQEQAKARQFVDQLTSSLEDQTGAITDQARKDIVGKLFDQDVLTNAKSFGLNLKAVTDAALGNKNALAQVRSELDLYVDSFEGDRTIQLKAGEAAERLFGKITDTNGALADARRELKLKGEAQGEDARTTAKTTQATAVYATELTNAKKAIQGLLDKENERRSANLSAFSDQTHLAEAIAAARKEATEGAKGLTASTEAGRANRDALASLADQWMNSADAVKNADGAYARIRKQFIDVAVEMGASKTKAKQLADELLGIPRSNPIEVNTPGMDQAIADARRLKEELISARRAAGNIALNQGARNRGELSDIRRAGGGPIYGPGTGTSDSVLMWGSNGEWMQPKRAVDYYGPAFMRRVQTLQLPKFAGGGQVGAAATLQTAGGQEISGILRIDGGTAFLQGVTRSAVSAAKSNATNARMMSSSDGIQRHG